MSALQNGAKILNVYRLVAEDWYGIFLACYHRNLQQARCVSTEKWQCSKSAKSLETHLEIWLKRILVWKFLSLRLLLCFKVQTELQMSPGTLFGARKTRKSNTNSLDGMYVMCSENYEPGTLLHNALVSPVKPVSTWMESYTSAC